MNRNRSFWLFFAASVVIACVGDLAPARMPLDYSAIVSRSIPLAALWAAIFIASVFLFRMRALWLLAGGPIALYWPVWLLVHGYPSCWYVGNCA